MEIKRILTLVDEVRSLSGRRTEPPLRKSAAESILSFVSESFIGANDWKGENSLRLNFETGTENMCPKYGLSVVA